MTEIAVPQLLQELSVDTENKPFPLTVMCAGKQQEMKCSCCYVHDTLLSHPSNNPSANPNRSEMPLWFIRLAKLFFSTAAQRNFEFYALMI